MESPSTNNARQHCDGRVIACSIYITVFALFVTLPMVRAFQMSDPTLSLYPIVSEVPVEENRTRAPRPMLSLLLQSGSKFADTLNGWFDDRIGFRDLFIRLKNQIDYSAFGVSKKVYIGKQELLFERATTNNNMVLERQSDVSIADRKRWFRQLAQVLRDRKIELIVMAIPDKSIGLSKFLPSGVPSYRRPEGSRYDEFRKFLAEDPTFTYIDVESLLQSSEALQTIQNFQGKTPPYFLTDIHLTAGASMPLVREIVRRVAQAEHRPDIEWRESFVKQTGPYYGSEARFLATLYPVTETVMSSPNWYEVGKDTPEGYWTVMPYSGGSAYPPFDFQFQLKPDICKERLPGLAVFGNSFSDTFWSLGLQRYFCFTRRSKTPSYRLPVFIQNLPADTKYFVFQFLWPYLMAEVTDLDPLTLFPAQR